MDSALQELLHAELDPYEIVEVLVRLTNENVIPEKLTPIAQFGDIITCRIRRADILEVYRSDQTKSMKAPRFVAYDASYSSEYISSSSEKEAYTETATGKNTVVAVMDWGIDFAHPNFRNPDGSTRLLALWDQSFKDTKGLAPYGYGRLFTRDQIDRALKSKTPYKSLRYHPGKSDSTGNGTHGTHVMDIAAGNGAIGSKGVASKADLIFVHLASRGTSGTANLGDSVRILEALDAINNLAEDRPLAINVSVGRHGGPHDGKTLVEQGIDNFLKLRNNTMVCQSTGNYFQSRTHHSDIVRPGKIKSFSFIVDKADTTLNEMEIWYPGSDLFSIELINNRYGKSFRCPVNSKRDVVIGGATIGRIYHRDKEPNNGKNHINLFLYKNAPSGRWTVKLKGKKIFDGRYHAWIERDGSCSTCQSRFDPSFAVTNATTGTIANGYNSIVVGAYDATSGGFKMAPFSSKGPTLDGRFKPDIIAPGWNIRAARSTPGSSQLPRPSTTRMSGTSMAAPRVAGATALVLELLPKNTPFWQIRNIIIGAADPVLGADATRTGGGKLNIMKAVATAKQYAEKRKALLKTLKPFGWRNTFRLPPLTDSKVLVPKATEYSENLTSAFESPESVHLGTEELGFNKNPNFLRGVEPPGNHFDVRRKNFESTTFTPSYLSKIFVISDSNAILRDNKLAPLKIERATQEVGRNAKGNAILAKGRGYRILKISKTISGNMVGQVATSANPKIPLGWTVASNFTGSFYNESLILRRAPINNSDPSAFTVVDMNAIIRNPNGNFTTTRSIIPIGAFVQLIGYDQSRRYAQVILKQLPSPASITNAPLWTAASNLQQGWLKIFGPNSAWKRGRFIGMLNLVDVVGTGLRAKQVALDTLSAYQNLCDNALTAGVQITLNSGFRSYPQQERLYINYKKGIKGYNLAALPGRSNHQNGIAFDLNTTGKKGTGWGIVYNWLKQHATSFGFLRTVRTEHWHWVYNPNRAAQAKQIGEYRSWMIRKSAEQVHPELEDIPINFEILKGGEHQNPYNGKEIEHGNEIYTLEDHNKLLNQNLVQNDIQSTNIDTEIEDDVYEPYDSFHNEFDNESYFDTTSIEDVKNIGKAVRANRRYGISLGWNVHHDKINDLLLPFAGMQNVSLSEDTFAFALSKWQKSKGFSEDDSDGILGPKTWRIMKGEIGIMATPIATTPVASATVEDEWNNLPNIKIKYPSLQSYLIKRAEVAAWGIPSPGSYIADAISEWNKNSGVHHYFGSFDGNPRKSYLNLKRLYNKKGISNPGEYISTNIRRYTFFNESSHGHIILKQKLASAEQQLKAAGHTFSFQSAWSFVPRTFNSNINKLSNHAIGKAVDIDPQSNPHITNKGEMKVIEAVCGSKLVNGFLRERDPDVFRRASDYFKATFNSQWVSQQTDQSILRVLRSTKRMKKLEKYARLGFCTLPGPLVRALQNAGLSWGGTWSSAKDFMHFETK